MKNEFEDLQQILEKQISSAQQGKIDEVENLLRQTDSIIDLRVGVREAPENIKRLYNELCLILKADMAGVKTALKHSKKNRLAAKTYRNNI